MIYLVTLAQAKLQLRILDTVQDADIEMKIAAASDIVMRHHKIDTVPAEWLIEGSPEIIAAPPWAQQATLLVMADLFENRESSTSNALSAAVKAIIPRDPTLA